MQPYLILAHSTQHLNFFLGYKLKNFTVCTTEFLWLMIVGPGYSVEDISIQAANVLPLDSSGVVLVG